MRSDVQLSDLDDDALAKLAIHALPDTDIREVMPFSPGSLVWTPQRLQEFIAFHHGRRGGLDGPIGEISLVILIAGMPSGIARLQRVAPETLEVGMWLTRSVRGRGIGGHVLDDVARMAVGFGARKLVADTTASNGPALAALTRIGADICAPRSDGRVAAELDLAAYAK